MSWSPCPDPLLGDRRSTDAIETLIVPRAVDLGEMTVRRALPSTKRQMVGPFIFFDQMGPAILPPIPAGAPKRQELPPERRRIAQRY